jgi:beta-aspartyl-peptidase (threonine type)
MDGRDLKAGAVAGVTRTRNRSARARRDGTMQHVMLTGEGADAFSKRKARTGRSQLLPERRWKSWKNGATSRARCRAISRTRTARSARSHSDTSGHVAAGTSTGGLTGKRWGRGRLADHGAGTYAADGLCAVSATGTGGACRETAARQVCDRMQWNRENVQAAADDTIKSIGGIGGDGGLIAMDGRAASHSP